MADYLDIAGRVRTTASDGVAMEAQEVKDLNLNKSQQEVNADVQTELGDRYTKEETYSKEQLDDLITTPDVNYVSVAATNATTAVTDILPATGEANTIYRVGNWDGTQYDPTMYALFAWNGTAYVCLAVRSFVGEVYDISVNHPDGGKPTPYAGLTAAIGTDGANIPADIRRGGMSIKFIQGTVQSIDNNYVQYFLTKDEWSASEADWEKINLEEEVSRLDQEINGKKFETKSLTYNAYSFKSGDKYRFVNYGTVRAYVLLRVTQSSTGQLSVGFIDPGNYIEVELESDYNYLYIHDSSASEKIFKILAILSDSIKDDVEHLKDGVLSVTTAVSNINAELADYDNIENIVLGIAAVQLGAGYINYNNWSNVDNPRYNHLVYPVTPGQSIRIVGIDGGTVDYGVLKTYSTPTEGGTIDYSSVISGRKRLSGSTLEATFTVPDDAHYIVTSNNYSSTNNYMQPTVFTVDGVNVLTGIPSVNERLDTKADKKSGILVYHNDIAENAFSDGVHPAFDFYTPNSAGNYFGFRLELCKHLAEDYYQYLWRVTTCGYYSYNESTGVFTRIANTLQGLENEFTFAPKDFKGFESYIGGYHGGERIDLDATNCYVKFFADGKILSIDSNTSNFTIRCNSFRYYQRASMHIVNDKATGEVVTGHPIFGYHIKDNIFEDCGFHIENTLDILTDATIPYDGIISSIYYIGLLCVQKGIGQNVILPDGVFKQTSGDNSYTNASNKKAKKAIYWNNTNQIGAEVSSETLQGLTEDDINLFMIWDRTYDTKYYRGVSENKNLTDLGIIRSKVDLQFR